MPKSYTVVDDYHDLRLDRWFKQNVIDLPHSLIEKIIRQNKIKVNKKKTKSSYRVQSGDLIQVYDILKFKPINKEKKIKYIPKNKELGKYDDYVIENNENFIVLNKPSGIPVQSGTKSFRNITDIIKHTKYFENSEPFIVHRIDKETSGIFIIAKNRKFAQLFTSLFRIRKIHKTYLALVYGKVNNSIKSMRDELSYYEG
ncbi:pseudouridine synthase, partial [Candidatus Pelagibacter bacterium]|nr:pseudouridine synthase [Candidatus Pelagibacter bacterium]